MKKLILILFSCMLMSFGMNDTHSTASWYGYNTRRITASGEVFDISNSEIRNSQLGTFESKLVSEDKIEK